MRAVVFASELPPGPGGIGHHAHHLALQLVDRGWSVTVLAPQDYASDDEIAEWTALQPYRVERLRPWPTSVLQALARAARLVTVVRRHRPDLVVASGLRVVWLCALLVSRLGSPWVAIGHGLEFGVGGWASRLTRWAFERARAVVCVSSYTAERLSAAGITPRRSEIIRNGADDQVFRPPTQPVVRGDGPRQLVTVGTVSRRKGQDLVVRALPAIVAAGVDVRYSAIGLDRNADDVRRLAEQLGVSERVQLTGRLDDRQVVERLGAADLFVLPSRHTAEGDFEGFGIAVVEAALCGTPAVVTRESGLVEAIADGDTGLAVPPDDPDALGAAILELLLDEPRRRRMAERARKRAVNEQTWQRRGEQYHRLLTEIARPS
ncbi:MAG: glycosyltransferase family 4 protein [Acidobacteriota bacterium]